jgi:hypothetical protein
MLICPHMMMMISVIQTVSTLCFWACVMSRDGKNYVVMNSWMPSDRPVDDLYDLKGTADDKLIRLVRAPNAHLTVI